MKLKSLAMVACAFIFAQTAAARETFTIQLNDRETSGSATLHLKNLLRDQHNINPANFQFVGARLVAKSKNGNGSAALQVGNWTSNDKRVNGNPADWNRSNANTFDQIDFNNNSGDDNGVWQIDLRGNIKTRKVIVVLDRNGGGGGGIRYHEIRCESNSPLIKRCAANGRVISVRLIRQHSVLPCVANQSFGADSREIWVRNGCRGTFEVGTRN